MTVGKKVLVLLAALAFLGALRAGPATAQTADLRIVTSASPASPTAGSPLTYAHTVSYASGSGATNVTVTNMIPPGTSFHEAGSDSRCSVDSCGTTVVCLLGSVTGSDTANVAVIPSAAGSITDVTGVAADQYDPVMTNNTSVTSTTVGPAQTYCISGTITLNGSALANVVVTAGSRSDVTDSKGYFEICGLADNTNYVVVPALGGYTFSPASRAAAIRGADVTGVDFAAIADTYNILGTVTLSGGGGLSGVTVSACSRSATTTASGAYTITGLANGTCTVTPTRTGYIFTPASRTVTISGGNVSGVNFTATPNFSISGTVTVGGAGLPGVTVSACSKTATTLASGAYTIPGLANGTCTVTPTLSPYIFTPVSRAVTVSGANVTGVNFTAEATYPISGNVTLNGAGLGGVTITVGAKSTTTTSAGVFYISGLTNGSYTVTPTRTGFTFSPINRPINIYGGAITGLNFTAESFVVTAASPASGPTAGGTVVTVTGSGFLSGATVKFGAVASPAVTFESSTSIRATTPPRALAGIVDVVVTNPTGPTATGVGLFTYEAPAPTNRFYPITPCRAVDTRNANGTYGGPAFSGGTPRDYDLRGLCGIPSTAQGLEVNMTVVGPSGQGAIQVAPAGLASALDLLPFETGMTRAQFLSIPLIGEPAGIFTVRAMPTTATVHLLIDVFGYHAP